MEAGKVVLDQATLKTAMQQAGFGTYAELIREAGVHRNTLHHYLSGKRELLPQPLQKLAASLGIEVLSLLKHADSNVGDEKTLIEILKPHSKGFPTAAFMLFGSRAKGTASCYSDWDIGISGGESAFDVDSYLALKGDLQDATANWPYRVDLVNLDLAPAWFLTQIDYQPRFLTGNRLSYHYFLGVLSGYRKSS